MAEPKLKILWVDDDTNILASLKRLFRATSFDLTALNSAQEALQLMQTTFFPVVISDQRMPEMTGLDFLEKVKNLHPLSTRVLVTALADEELVRMAVNRAGVFRFFNKPWEPTEILHDLQICAEHSQQAQAQRQLLLDVTAKKRELEELTKKLATKVETKSRKIDTEMETIDLSRQRIRSIIRFVKDVARLASVQELMVLIRREIRGIPRAADPLLILKHEDASSELVFFRGLQMNTKRLGSLVKTKNSLVFNDRVLSEQLAKVLGRPFGKLAVVGASFGSLVIEHDIQDSDKQQIVDFLEDRIGVLSIAVDRLSQLEIARSAASDWERTFSTHRDPIAIVESDFRLLRSNRGVRGQQTLCHNILMNNDRVCEGCPIVDSKNTDSVGEITGKDKIFKVYSFPILSLHPTDTQKFIHTYVDVTEERNLQSQLLQAEKMSALGLLSNSVSHELNNPLTGIRSMSQILRSEEKESSRFAQDLLEIEKASARCEEIIKSFQEFALGEVEKGFEKLSLQEVVKKTIPFLKTSLRFHRWHIDEDSEPVYVFGYSSLLQQVVFNLVNNACQAMKESGEVTIRVFSEGKSSLISVQDTGPGIESHLLPHIFEPFFTTKSVGHGTGLGLKISQSIVKNHGGRISVKSEPRKGTLFSIEIPRCQ